MRTNKLISILILSAFFLVGSCGNNKHVTKQITKKISDKELRENLFLMDSVSYDFFYSKIGVNFKNSLKEQSFKATVKMRVDSAFSGTISYASFIAATYLIDKDSVKFSDKQNKCYFTENLTYISATIGVELEYNFFQDLLLAKPINLDKSIKYKQLKDKDKQFYILSSHSRHKFQQIENDKMNIENEKNNLIYTQYFFSSDSLHLAKMHIEIPADTVSIDVNYVESKYVNGIKVPELTTLLIKHPKDSLTISLNYGKVKLNQPKTIKFSVPESYEDCNK